MPAMTWVITLHGVDADGVKHSVVHRVSVAAVKVTAEDVEQAKRQGLEPGPWLAETKSWATIREWKNKAERDGFYSKDGKRCTFTAIDSAVVDD